ncbi:hypothetical protein [Paenibacillus sp. EPM92]|nr:hypothetical protein [Paenibacillus sp. EPM92]
MNPRLDEPNLRFLAEELETFILDVIRDEDAIEQTYIEVIKEIM